MAEYYPITSKLHTDGDVVSFVRCPRHKSLCGGLMVSTVNHCLHYCGDAKCKVRDHLKTVDFGIEKGFENA